MSWLLNSTLKVSSKKRCVAACAPWSVTGNWSSLVVALCAAGAARPAERYRYYHRDGYGFLRVEGRKDDLYLSSEQMNLYSWRSGVAGITAGVTVLAVAKRGIVRVLVPKNQPDCRSLLH